MDISGINNALPIAPAGQSSIGGTINKNTTNFADMLNSMIDQTNTAQLGGEQAISDLESGKAEHLHEVMIRMEEADLSIRALMQLRNKAKAAYDEVMQIQI
jgi:flagellar hook-basal body complex protein FliE